MVKRISTFFLLLALTTQAWASGVSTQYGLGQQDMANSQPVVLPSDQSAIPISSISGPVALPTGAATEAKQDVGNASLSSIDTKVATAAKQDAQQATLDSIDTKVATEATLAELRDRHKAASAAITQVASSATTTLLLASNANRRGVKLYNDSNQAAYVAFAATASTSAFTIKMAPRSFYEMEFPIYTGDISALWDSANGNMMVTAL